jgi:uncharacterized protein (TIGR02246 family)
LAAALCAGPVLLAAADDPGIAKVRSAYEAATAAGDAAKIASLYTEDGIEMPPNEPMLKGRAAIEAWNKKFFASATAKSTIKTMDTHVAGSLAYDAGTYKQSIKFKTGQAIEDAGKYVVILKKDAAGAWKLAYVCYNSDLPPPPAPAPPKP